MVWPCEAWLHFLVYTLVTGLHGQEEEGEKDRLGQRQGKVHNQGTKLENKDTRFGDNQKGSLIGYMILRNLFHLYNYVVLPTKWGQWR